LLRCSSNNRREGGFASGGGYCGVGKKNCKKDRSVRVGPILGVINSSDNKGAGGREFLELGKELTLGGMGLRAKTGLKEGGLWGVRRCIKREKNTSGH